MWEQRYLTHSFNSADSNSFYLTYYLMAKPSGYKRQNNWDCLSTGIENPARPGPS